MLWRKEVDRATERKGVGSRGGLLAVAAVAAMMVSAVVVPEASAQRAPKNGVYLYVGVPDASGEESLAAGGEGLLVFDVANNYAFVERIALPAARQRTQAHFKGIDANVKTGLVYLMLAERLVGVDLETSQVLWSQLYDGGCCDRGVVSPHGETIYMAANGEPWWYVLSAYNGELIHKIEDWAPNQRAHNTIMKHDGDMALLSPDNNILYLYNTKTHEKIREIGPMQGRNRPYAVNSKWTRVYSSNNGTLGFQVSDIETGQVLHRVNAPGPQPCITSAGGHGTCQHGIAMTQDETALWIVSPSLNQLVVFDMTSAEPPVYQHTIQDYAPSGWITCSIDGYRMYPASGTVYNTNTFQEITRLVDERGRHVESEKMMEIRFENGKVVEVGDQWCNGKKHLTKAAPSKRRQQ